MAILVLAGQSEGGVGMGRPSEAGMRGRKPGENPGEYRACIRKRRYATQSEAKKAAERASRHKDAPKIFTYRCAYCGGWHLTHHKPGK